MHINTVNNGDILGTTTVTKLKGKLYYITVAGLQTLHESTLIPSQAGLGLQNTTLQLNPYINLIVFNLPVT